MCTEGGGGSGTLLLLVMVVLVLVVLVVVVRGRVLREAVCIGGGPSYPTMSHPAPSYPCWQARNVCALLRPQHAARCRRRLAGSCCLRVTHLAGWLMPTCYRVDGGVRPLAAGDLLDARREVLCGGAYRVGGPGEEMGYHRI